ncbi:hypothetical protein AA980_09045 [Neobacillus vireti]|nr:hypothetical protein AA980_09045 [Neobacillus vireti]
MKPWNGNQHSLFNTANAKKVDIPIWAVHFKKGGILESIMLQGFPHIYGSIQKNEEKIKKAVHFTAFKLKCLFQICSVEVEVV